VSDELRERLLALERELAGGGGEEYERILAPQAVVIVPGATMDKVQTVAAMQESEGWDEFELEGARLLEITADSAALVYTFQGRRGETTYRAALTSVYARQDDHWHLVLHQQTPLPT